jgi:hypothetical protein
MSVATYVATRGRTVAVTGMTNELLLPQANLAAHERVPDGNQLEKKLGEEYLLCTNKTLRTLLPVSSDWYHQEQCQLYDHTTSF